MFTRNFNVDDGFVNEVMEHVSHFVYGQRCAANTVAAVGVTFNNINVGKKICKENKKLKYCLN